MGAWELAAGAVWAMSPVSLETLLEVAARAGDGPEAVAARLGRPLDNARTVSVRDGVAIVPVVGPLFRRANLLTQVSGATSVEVLATDLREAAANPAVRAILLDVDSPGGEANGVGELAGMVHALRVVKPVHAYVGGQGCSGAYWLASACERVVLADTAQAGSIGVVAVYRKGQDREAVEFVSSQSPQKRPDLETEGGRAQVQRVVDDIAAVFVRDVAAYRGVAEERVLSDFGAGGVLVGASAVAAGLADSVGTFEGTLASLAGCGVSGVGCRVGATARRASGSVPLGAQAIGKERGMDGKAALEEGVQAGDPGVLGDASGDALAGAVAAAGVGCGVSGVGDAGARSEGEAMEAAALGGSELHDALARIAALESEQAVLQAREARRAVAESVAGMRFGEDGKVLAPSSRSQLIEALMPLGSEQRASVLSALQSQQFVALGERGFTSAVEADAETLSAAEEEHVRALASRNRLGYEEVREQFLAVRRRRAA